MKGMKFKEATTALLPPDGQEESVYPLPVWKVPGQPLVISKWKLSLRERLHCLIKGYVWLHVVAPTHPPLTIETAYPFEHETSGLYKGLKSAALIWLVILLLALLLGAAWKYSVGLSILD